MKKQFLQVSFLVSSLISSAAFARTSVDGVWNSPFNGPNSTVEIAGENFKVINPAFNSNGTDYHITGLRRNGNFSVQIGSAACDYDAVNENYLVEKVGLAGCPNPLIRQGQLLTAFPDADIQQKTFNTIWDNDSEHVIPASTLTVDIAGKSRLSLDIPGSPTVMVNFKLITAKDTSLVGLFDNEGVIACSYTLLRSNSGSSALGLNASPVLNTICPAKLNLKYRLAR